MGESNSGSMGPSQGPSKLIDLGMVSSVSMHMLSLHEWSALEAARVIRGSCRDWFPHFNGILSMKDRVFLESLRTSSVVLAATVLQSWEL